MVRGDHLNAKDDDSDLGRNRKDAAGERGRALKCAWSVPIETYLTRLLLKVVDELQPPQVSEVKTTRKKQSTTEKLEHGHLGRQRSCRTGTYWLLGHISVPPWSHTVISGVLDTP